MFSELKLLQKEPTDLIKCELFFVSQFCHFQFIKTLNGIIIKLFFIVFALEKAAVC